MDERCALCGNHTAQMDLAEIAFEGLKVRACPYCRKQLEQTLKNPAENDAWLRSILSVDTKGVRSEAVTAALTRICYIISFGAQSGTRTHNPSVNSRMLYH